jgi:hypothetical protein
MTLAAFRRALRAFTSRAPFKPFLLSLNDGSQILVAHPEAVPEEGSVFVYFSRGFLYQVFDCTSVCQVLDVVPPAQS